MLPVWGLLLLLGSTCAFHMADIQNIHPILNKFDPTGPSVRPTSDPLAEVDGRAVEEKEGESWCPSLLKTYPYFSPHRQMLHSTGQKASEILKRP